MMARVRYISWCFELNLDDHFLTPTLVGIYLASRLKKGNFFCDAKMPNSPDKNQPSAKSKFSASVQIIQQLAANRLQTALNLPLEKG